MKTRVVLLIFLLLGLTSEASTAGTESSIRVPVYAAADLFAIEGVAAEIGLDAAQRAESARLAKKYEEDGWEDRLAMFWAVYGKDEKRKAELEHTEGDKDRPLAAFLKTLQPAQRARLGELFVQWLGGNAVFNEDVQRALNLMPAQRREITAIDKAITAEEKRLSQQEMEDALGAFVTDKKISDASKAERAAAHEKIVAGLRAKGNGIPSPKQKQQLEKLKGKPFSFPRN